MPKPPDPGFAVPGVPPFLHVADSSPHYWIGVRMAVPTGNGGTPRPGTLLLSSPTLLSSAFLAPWRPWLTLVALLFATTLVCWLPFVRGVTTAISQMTATTRAIAEGRFEGSVSSDRGDELGLLGASINRMSKQLEALLDGQKSFLRDAAHELRSPLGRMQVAVSILERDTASSAQTERIADLKEEVEAMAELTDQLLSFARAESRSQEIALEPVRLSDVVCRAVKAERRDHQDIQIKIDPKLKAVGHPDMLFRCFSNLIRNAVVHGGTGTLITISSLAKSDTVAITVTDHGPGVPAKALDNLFDSFFRLEAARSRSTGGAGLGLSIVKTCVETCRGSVECRNGIPTGLEVTVTLGRA